MCQNGRWMKSYYRDECPVLKKALNKAKLKVGSPSQVIDNTGITFILGGILTLRTPIFRPKLAF